MECVQNFSKRLSFDDAIRCRMSNMAATRKLVTEKQPKPIKKALTAEDVRVAGAAGNLAFQSFVQTGKLAASK